MTRHDMITHGYRIGAAGGKAHEENLGAAMLAEATAGKMNAPRGNWDSHKFGGAPPQEQVEARRALVLQMAHEGLTLEEQEAKSGLDREVIANDRRRLREMGHDFPKLRRGLVHHATVKKLHAQGLTDAEIAVRMGCTPSNITKHRKRAGLAPN